MKQCTQMGQHNLIVITVDHYSVATKQVFCCSIEVTCLYIGLCTVIDILLLLLVHYQVSNIIIKYNNKN